MSVNVPDKIRSNCFGKVRTACNDKQTQRGTISLFSMVIARMPLWGFGSFSGTTPVVVNSTEMFGNSGTSILSGSSSVVALFNSTWPAVYNTLTESWSETHGGSQTITTAYSQYADVFQTTTTSSSGPFVGDGTITSITITSSLISIGYTFTLFLNPANPIMGTTFTGTYTAQLSGSILDPSGTGPFDPGDPSYGWAALTSAANTLLAGVSIPAISGSSTWTTIDPISTSPFYRITSDTYNSATLWDDIFAAAYGFPTSPSGCQTQFMPPSIMDWPIPATNAQPTGAYTNQGACMCAKSTWDLNGAGWGNPAIDPGILSVPPTGLAQIMNDHCTIYAQTVDLTNFNSSGTIGLDTNYPNPIPWPVTKTFNPSDVTSAIGSGAFGLLGFQAHPQ